MNAFFHITFSKDPWQVVVGHAGGGGVCMLGGEGVHAGRGGGRWHAIPIF